MPPPRNESDRRVSPEKSAYSSGSGENDLRDRPVEGRLGADEVVQFLLSNKKKGLEEAGSGERHLPGEGRRAFAAITDRRVLFVVGGAGGEDAVFGVPYAEIDHVGTGGGVLTKHLEVGTVEDERWRFFVRRGADLEAAAEFVDRAAIVRARVDSKLREAKRRVVAVDDHLAAGEYASAEAAVARAEEALEDAREATRSLEDDRTVAVQDRIADVERRVRRMRVRGHLSRAEYLVHEGEARWRREDFEGAYRRHADARTQLERALEVAEANGFEEVTGIPERLDRATDAMESLAEAPLERAGTVHERAGEATDPETRADLLEEALERYRAVLELDWGAEERRFAGDRETIRGRIESIVGELAELRRELAGRHREAGVYLEREGRHERAVEAYEAAAEPLQSAIEIAEELDPEAAGRLREERDELGSLVEDARVAAAEEVFEFVGDRGDEPAVDSLPEEGLLELDDGAFARVVARYLRERGWRTTRLGADSEFDLRARRGGESLFVLASRCPPEATHAAGAVRVLADRGDAHGEADAVAVATTGTFTEDARAVADDRDAWLLDREDLTEGLRADAADRPARDPAGDGE